MNCVECGHNDVDREGYCKHETPHPKALYGNYPKRYCGHKCAFPVSTTEAGEDKTSNNAAQNSDVPRTESQATPELSADLPGLDAFARAIVKRISDAAIELAFVRHGLTSDEYIEDEELGLDEGVESWKGFVEDIKLDIVNCLTGDDFGCLDPEDLDETNCELIWLKAQLTNTSASDGTA